MDSDRVRELPLNGRNFLQLAFLSGGVNEVSPASAVFTSNVGPPGRLVVLPGTFPYSVGYSLNGFNIRSSRDGELALSPSVAAIDQFKIQVSFLMPDQGASSAVVNIVTKSGSNQFHGEVFEFFRNRVLDARSFFAPAREDLKRNQFGAALGGPLKKDRIWFHAFYEQLREMAAFSVSGYTPTARDVRRRFCRYGAHRLRSRHLPAGIRDPSAVPRSRDSGGPREPGRPEPSSLLPSRHEPLDAGPAIFSGIRAGRSTTSKAAVGWTWRWALAPSCSASFFGRARRPIQPGLFPLSGLSYENESTLAMLQHTWSLSATW